MVQQPLPLSQERRFVALSQLLQTLREQDDIDTLIQFVVEHLERETGYGLIWVGLYDPADQVVIGRGGSSNNGRRLLQYDRLPVDSGSLLEETIVGRRLVAVANLAEEPRAGRWAGVARSLNIQGALLFPIRCRERCYGVMLLGHSFWGMTPRSEDKALLSILAGQLALTLQRLETQQQQQQIKRPEEPLFRLLQQLRSIDSLQDRLELLVAESYAFFGSSRTSLYWFEPETRYFWQRIVKQSTALASGRKGSAAEIAVADCPLLYQALNQDRLVSISDADSSMNGEISADLLKRMQAKSLLIAPIRLQNRLLGFVAAESLTKRMWSLEEKRLLQGIAQLGAMLAPLGEIEQDVLQTKADQDILTQLSRVIYSDHDWQDTLHRTAEKLLQRLQAERLLLLRFDRDLGHFQIMFQHHVPGRRKRVEEWLDGLHDLDRRQVEQHSSSLCIEDWNHDLKLMAWRAPLMAAQVQSLMVCRTHATPYLDGLLIVTHETPRSWGHGEQELFCSLAYQLGTVLQQRHVERQIQDERVLSQALHWGLTNLQKEKHPDRLEALAVQALAQLLQAQMVTLITWPAHSAVAQVAASVVNNPAYSIAEGLTLNIATEPLIQRLRSENHTLILEPHQLAPETQQWLGGTDSGTGLATETGTILVMPFRETNNDWLQGLILAISSPDRPWTEREFQLAEILITQTAWSRRSLHLIAHLQTNQERLQQLNWYKHFCGQELKRSITQSLQRVQDLSDKDLGSKDLGSKDLGSKDLGSKNLGSKDLGSKNLGSKDLGNRDLGNRDLNNIRTAIQQPLEPALKTLEQLLLKEQWSLSTELKPIPLTTVLKRAIDRLDPFLKRHQLWYQVHGETRSAQLHTDTLKLEGVLHEVLVAACERCLPGGRLDIWCRFPEPKTLDLSITDNGFMEPHLMAALQDDADTTDPRTMATLEYPPGLHLSLGRRILKQLNASLDFLPLEDGRVMSRLLVPLINS
jgi:GAF domain-containing protein